MDSKFQVPPNCLVNLVHRTACIRIGPTPEAARGFSGKIRFQYKTARSSLASVLSSGAAAEGVNRSHRSDGGRGLGGEGCQPLG